MIHSGTEIVVKRKLSIAIDDLYIPSTKGRVELRGFSGPGGGGCDAVVYVPNPTDPLGR